MRRRNYYIRSLAFLSLIILLTLLLVLRFSKPSEYCSPSEYTNLSVVDVHVDKPDLSFRFPVDNLAQDQMIGAVFATSGQSRPSPNSKEYHAAEDYHQPAGNPVYAMADGIISFSGPMDGYGWLIIVDHPEFNLYSLYGHLSPSRWKTESGFVEKGELIAYLGDPDENGGSRAKPLRPHLHFGIRLGQRTDYPSMGEWRWQAGWIKYCPQALGWLQPSKIIIEQKIPDNGLHDPEASFMAIWREELLLSLLILIGAITALFATTTKGNTLLLIGYSVVLPLLTWFAYNKGLVVAYALLALCIIFIVIRLFKFIRHKSNKTFS